MCTGVVTVGFGFIVIFLLPPVPEKLNRGWTSDEKAIAIRRSREAFNSSDAKIQLKQIVALLKDPKAWFLSKHLTTDFFMSLTIIKHLFTAA